MENVRLQHIGHVEAGRQHLCNGGLACTTIPITDHAHPCCGASLPDVEWDVGGHRDLPAAWSWSLMAGCKHLVPAA